MKEKDFINQYRSWRGDKEKCNAYHTLRNMDLYARRQIDHGRKDQTEND